MCEPTGAVKNAFANGVNSDSFSGAFKQESIMKKIVVFLTAIILLQAGSTFAQEDALIYEDDGAYPVQASLYPTLQLVPYDRDVTGVRLNLIGVNRNMTGVDVGVINQSDESFRGVGVGVVNLCQGDVGGLSIGFINHVNGDMVGFQGIPVLSFWNALNVVHGKITGIQGGLYNQAHEISGLQGGLFNVGYQAKGGQIGLYNYSDTFGGVQLGIINIAYEEAHGLQVGLYNGTGHFRGLQIGIVNQTQTLEGLQLGLVNAVSQKESLPVMVFANWQF